MSGGRRVAVTGIGLMTALGATRDETWHAMLEGRFGIDDVSLFDTTGYRSPKAAELGAYAPDRSVPPKVWARLSRADHTAILASREALSDSGLMESGIDLSRAGVMLCTGTADLMRNEEWFAEAQRRGFRHAPPLKIFNHFPSTPSDVLASHFGLEGEKASVLSACSSSTVAIGYAADAIRWGRLDAALAGASDVLCRRTLSGFNALRLVDTEPCRPFCRTRKGMNIGEAAAILVLEDYERAARRGAKIYAEVLGYGLSSDAKHVTEPNMRRLLRYVVAHSAGALS